MAINLDHVTEQIQVTDDATNASLTVQPKGTGAFNIAAGSSGLNISNGGTVTALTRTGGGSGYTSAPSVAISAPTTAGGVQATATVAMFNAAATIASGGTGYTVGNTLTMVGGTITAGFSVGTFTVTSVSAGAVTGVTVLNFSSYTVLPSNPVTVTGGTGTGCTLNVTYGIGTTFTITNAGSGYVEQPTVTFSGGGGSGAAAFATVGSSSTIKQLGGSLGFSGSSGEVFRIYDFGGQAGVGVRGHTLSGVPSAIFPTPANSAQTNIEFEVASLGTGSIRLATNGQLGSGGAFNQTRQLVASHTASAVNYVQVTGATTGNGATISSQGSDANINMFYTAKGTGGHVFYTNAGVSGRQFDVLHASSAVNRLTVTGAATGVAPSMASAGSDTNIDLALTTKGTGALSITSSNTVFRVADDTASGASLANEVRITGARANLGRTRVGFTNAAWLSSNDHFSFRNGTPTSDGNEQVRIAMTSGAVNYVQVTGATAGNWSTISAQGSDSNVSLNITTKGTGTLNYNGAEIAKANHKYHEFSIGSYYYDSYQQGRYFRLFTENAVFDTSRFAAISNVEYYNYTTSAWTAWVGGDAQIRNLLDGNQTTYADIAHAQRTFRFTINKNSGWPTNALIAMYMSWFGNGWTNIGLTIEDTADQVTWTTKETRTFGAGTTSTDYGWHAYYSGSLHNGRTLNRITFDIEDWVDQPGYTTKRINSFSIFSNYDGGRGTVGWPGTTDYYKNASFIGGIQTADDTNGTLAIGRYNSSDGHSYLDTTSSATGMFQRVNYSPVTRLERRDSSVNYIQFRAGVTSEAPRLSVGGSDTDIDLALTPKGTGNVRFGTYTGTALSIAGYIEIKDASGTIRRLAVVA